MARLTRQFRVFLGAFAAALGIALPAPAQDRGTTSVPPTVADEIEMLFNAAATTRRSGSTSIAAGDTINGDLAVRSGPLTIAGYVRGRLLVINSDVTFSPGARVDGNVLVVGGRVIGRDDAEIGGDLRLYAETLRYRLDGEELVVIGDVGAAQRTRGGARSRRAGEAGSTEVDAFNTTVFSAGVYNRVEGLPIKIGPRMRLNREWGTVTAEARGIVRTAEPIEWDRGTLGHDARLEARWRHGAGLGIGVTHFDKIEPIERWHLRDNEVSLAAAGIRRDFRDYYARHGGSAFIRGYVAANTYVSFALGEEKWGSRDARNPWTLFRDDRPWWPNPSVDNGRARLATTSLTVDTRNDRGSPSRGWLIQADVERGEFEPAVPDTDVPFNASTRTYTSGFLDLRRYNRLAPGAQFNVRVVVGGWLDGDVLPLQRRLSVGGPGTLPGFDYRHYNGEGEDRLQCSEVDGPTLALPALCDRVALIQMEYRGDLSWEFHGDRADRWYPTEFDFPTWVLFANAGRGWRAKNDGVTTYATESFPELRTFKTDIGVGLDFGSLSLALAKSMSDKDEPMNFVLRLNRRF
jgi:hypothetical protein